MKKRRINLITTFCTSLFLAIPVSQTIVAHSSSQKHLTRQTAEFREGFENKFYSETKQVDEKEVTDNQIKDYINSTCTKLECKLFSIGASTDEVKKTVAQYKGNCKKIANDINCDEQKESENAIILKAFQKESARLGIDVVDFNLFNNFAINSVSSMFSESLQNAKTTDAKKISEISDNLKSNLQDLSNKAQKRMWSNLELSTHLKDSIGDVLSMCLSSDKEYDETESVVADASLYSVLSCVQNDLQDENKLEWLPTADDFVVSKIADYTKNNTGWKEKDRVDWKTNDNKINYDNYSSIFSYTYDVTYGSNLTDYLTDVINPEEILEDDTSVAISGSVYSYTYQNVLDKIFKKQPLSSLNTGNAYYAPGEIIPGYALHTEIEKIEDTKDSHECNVTFKFGISDSKKDPEGKNIIWIDNDFSNKKQSSDQPQLLSEEQNEEKEKSYMLKTFAVRTDSAKVNISKNKYYKAEGYEANIAGEKPESDGSYFGGNKLIDRTYIDQVLAQKIKNYDKMDTIDLKGDKAILVATDDLTPENAANIPQPKIQEFKEKYLHTNQTIGLIANDINTNTNSLRMHWSIVDIDQNKDSGFTELQIIPWVNGGKKINDIWVQYAVSPEVMADIVKGTQVEELLRAVDINYNFFTAPTNIAGKPTLSKLWQEYYLSHKVILISQWVVESLMCVSAVIGAFLAPAVSGIIVGLVIALAFCYAQFKGLLSLIHETKEQDKIREHLKFGDEIFKDKNINYKNLQDLYKKVLAIDKDNMLLKANTSYKKQRELSEKIYEMMCTEKQYDENADYSKFFKHFVEKNLKTEDQKVIIDDWNNASSKLKSHSPMEADLLYQLIDLSGTISAFAMKCYTLLNTAKYVASKLASAENLEWAEQAVQRESEDLTVAQQYASRTALAEATADNVLSEKNSIFNQAKAIYERKSEALRRATDYENAVFLQLREFESKHHDEDVSYQQKVTENNNIKNNIEQINTNIEAKTTDLKNKTSEAAKKAEQISQKEAIVDDILRKTKTPLQEQMAAVSNQSSQFSKEISDFLHKELPANLQKEHMKTFEDLMCKAMSDAGSSRAKEAEKFFDNFLGKTYEFDKATLKNYLESLYTHGKFNYAWGKRIENLTDSQIKKGVAGIFESMFNKNIHSSEFNSLMGENNDALRNYIKQNSEDFISCFTNEYKVGRNQPVIESLSSKIDAAEGEIQKIRNEVNTITEEAGALQDQITRCKQEITQLQQTKQEQSALFETNKSKIADQAERRRIAADNLERKRAEYAPIKANKDAVQKEFIDGKYRQTFETARDEATSAQNSYNLAKNTKQEAVDYLQNVTRNLQEAQNAREIAQEAKNVIQRIQNSKFLSVFQKFMKWIDGTLMAVDLAFQAADNLFGFIIKFATW